MKLSVVGPPVPAAMVAPFVGAGIEMIIAGMPIPRPWSRTLRGCGD